MTYEEILGRMTAAYEEKSGFVPDPASDVGIRMAVLAKVAGDLYGEAEMLGQQIFPQTATAEALDRHAQTRGLMRKPAIAAAGTLRFGRETPAAGDIPVPAGTVCSTRGEEGIYFETTAEAAILSGETETEIPARAVEAGRVGNVAAGSVCLMITAAPGVTWVGNPAAFTGGVDAEEDTALRERLLHSYANISNGTNTAFYYDVAMGREGVRSVNVLPRKRGRGTVDVVICCGDSAAEAATAAEIQEVLAEEKEINVDVSVYPAIRDRHNLTVALAVKADADFAIVSAHCREAITAYADSLGVGEPLLRARLGQVILGVEGVYNYSLKAPAADLLPEDEHVIRPGIVTVERLVTP